MIWTSAARKVGFRFYSAAALRCSLIGFFAPARASPGSRTSGPQAQDGEIGLLKLLGIEAPPESIDYVRNKTQFQLHTLLTEQRHPKTWNLSERIADGYGRRAENAVLRRRGRRGPRSGALASDTGTIEQAAAAAAEAILSGKKIYIYGCGATGRLAKQMESAFWRPFWKEVKANEQDLDEGRISSSRPISRTGSSER